MKDIRHYLMVTLATAAFVTFAAGPALAWLGNSKDFSVPRKKVQVQHKKPQISAHHIRQGGKKRTDYDSLNR